MQFDDGSPDQQMLSEIWSNKQPSDSPNLKRPNALSLRAISRQQSPAIDSDRVDAAQFIPQRPNPLAAVSLLHPSVSMCNIRPQRSAGLVSRIFSAVGTASR